MPRHVYKYGIIGNCSYTAHIDANANVSWLCWPRFDSSFVFGGLLAGEDKGGRFSVLPASEKYTSRQYYLENTNVLCTEFDAPDGRFRVIDCAPRFEQHERYFKPLMLVRKIEVISGSPRVRVACRPVYEYGQRQPRIQMGSNHIRYQDVGTNTRLTTDISLNSVIEERPFVLNGTKYLVLTWGPPLEAALQATSEEFIRSTVRYWREWILRCSIGNFHQGMVIRSALTLKLHQYDDTGAIIASATTSLPESPGSGRTWDYRFCWMRDSYYTLAALNSIGHFEELEHYAEYIQNIAVAREDHYGPVYSITGDSNIIEDELMLPGYLGNRPVRVGNQAHTHIQNDVYGQILVSLLPLYVDQRFLKRDRPTSVGLIYSLLRSIERTMDEPDAGLWEFRNRAQKHAYTFLFHWAGANAAIRIARYLGDPKMEELAKRLCADATKQIEACYSPKRAAYTQAIGVENLDASLLQLITLGYLDPTSKRAIQHLRALEKELRAPEGLFYRYMHSDDFGRPETTFLVCSYWHIEALAALGLVDEAIAGFEGLLRFANPLGLLSEDVDAKTGSQWGNFPQTYSHVGLMNAAFRIARKLDRPDFLADIAPPS